MTKALVWSTLICVSLTVVLGLPVVLGSNTVILQYLATPFLYPGCLFGWMMKGDNFASSQEFLEYGFAASIGLNTVLGAAIGLCIGLVRRRRAANRAA